MNSNSFSEITPDILTLSKYVTTANQIDPELYTKLDVKRGLRDINGKGVLAGLTAVSYTHLDVYKRQNTDRDNKCHQHKNHIKGRANPDHKIISCFFHSID